MKITQYFSVVKPDILIPLLMTFAWYCPVFLYKHIKWDVSNKDVLYEQESTKLSKGLLGEER